MYSIEHLIFTFTAGLILGSISTIFLTKREMTMEMITALLIMIVWIGMHAYGFFFGNDVDWVFNIVGFGAAGTFVGVNLRSGVGLSEAVKLLIHKK